ncbi:MAG: hypothetical protein GYB65_02705 [Chloroflexi bacterium]|nr:hypothetical protein [Chloroflexota bacterium]
MAKARYYHPDYRQAEVSAIVEALDQGNSVSVIGPPSIGKTNLLRFLDQERLSVTDPNSPWMRYAPNSLEQGPVVAINIDPNALLPALPSERGRIAAEAWPGFELLTHRTTITPQLYPVLHRRRNDQPDDTLLDQVERLQARFESAHLEVTDFEDYLHAHLALRHLENIINATLTSHRVQQTPIRLAYFMDEFERLLGAMPDYFFVALRSIRDRFKYSVMFVTFTRNSLDYLSGERLAVLEPFIELFNDSTVYLRPFGDDDAWRMIEQLEQRSVSKDDYALGLLIRETGGFAGLLRAGFKHTERLAEIAARDYRQAITQGATLLSAEPNIQAECATLLRGLNREEIATLYAVVNTRRDLNPVLVRELVNKSLLAQDNAGIRVIPPVLAAYIANTPTPPEGRAVTPPVTLPEV